MEVSVGESGGLLIEKVYNSMVLQTSEGKKLYICMRDYGFDIRLNESPWYHINDESDIAKLL